MLGDAEILDGIDLDIDRSPVCSELIELATRRDLSVRKASDLELAIGRSIPLATLDGN